tara:strand:+ start:611 stop:820 length:210 start_codon:yes stop_codon:yes gene_type:complete
MGIFSAISTIGNLMGKLMGFVFMKRAIEGSILKKDLKNIKEKTNVKKDIARSSAADRRKRLRSSVRKSK